MRGVAVSASADPVSACSMASCGNCGACSDWWEGTPDDWADIEDEPDTDEHEEGGDSDAA